MFNNFPVPSMYGNPGYGFRNPGYPQPPAPQQPQLQQASVTYVTGMGPVDAAQAPFDSTPLFFYDTAADVIYIKQFDSSNGTAPVTVYRTDRKPAQPQFATVEMLAALSQRVEEMAAMMQPRKATKKEADAE